MSIKPSVSCSLLPASWISGAGSRIPSIAMLCVVGVAAASTGRASIVGETMTTTGPKIGTWNAKATPVGHSNSPNTVGGFLKVYALSSDTEATPTISEDSVPTPMPYTVGVPYATKQTKATGIKYEAQSKVTATATSVTKKEIQWNSVAANYGIDVLAPTGTSGETATASWTVFDPISFDPLGFEYLLNLSFTPEDGWGFMFPTLAPGETASADTSGSAGTTLPGHTDLFSWDISFGIPGQSPVVSFTSDPLLGLDDGAVEAAILSRYSYSSASNSWTFDATGFSLSATLDIPATTAPFSISTSMSSEMEISSPGVPEVPSSLLLATGCVLIGLGSWRRRLATQRCC